MQPKSPSPDIKKRCAGGGFFFTQNMISTRMLTLFVPPVRNYCKYHDLKIKSRVMKHRRKYYSYMEAWMVVNKL